MVCMVMFKIKRVHDDNFWYNDRNEEAEAEKFKNQKSNTSLNI